jgi:uncharacterized membrane protein
MNWMEMVNVFGSALLSGLASVLAVFTSGGDTKSAVTAGVTAAGTAIVGHLRSSPIPPR